MDFKMQILIVMCFVYLTHVEARASSLLEGEVGEAFGAKAGLVGGTVSGKTSLLEGNVGAGLAAAAAKDARRRRRKRKNVVKMSGFGAGTCKASHLPDDAWAGEDDLGLGSEEECTSLCLQNPDCYYVSYYGDMFMGHCYRFFGKQFECELVEGSDGKTFRKVAPDATQNDLMNVLRTLRFYRLLKDADAARYQAPRDLQDF